MKTIDCPKCGTQNLYGVEQKTGTVEERPDGPAPGDVMVCDNCAVVFLYLGDTARRLTPEEIDNMPPDFLVEIAKVVMEIRQQHLRRHSLN